MPSSTKLTIKCTNCGEDISVNEALTHELSEKIEGDFKQKYNQAFKEEKEKLTKQLETQLRDKYFNEAKQEAQKTSSDEIKFLNEQLIEKNKRIDEAQKLELEVRKDKAKFEDAKRQFELEKQRQLDLEREKMRNDIEKTFSEDYRFKISEKEKQLSDASKVIEELKRKVEQGSQQTQGEVLELELEEILKNEFQFDQINPIAKGVNGADIMQIIHDNMGRICGTITWESKHTKSWNENWIQKLKDDQRNAKAEVAVIVTTVLPKEIKNFAYKDGVWITNFESVLGLAMSLRMNLVSLAQTKLSVIGKNEKMEVLYSYLTGTEFRQRVESIVETFISLKNDLEKEKLVYQKMWAKREKQIQKVVDNTLGMHGDLHGLMGGSLPGIKGIDLDLIEDFGE